MEREIAALTERLTAAERVVGTQDRLEAIADSWDWQNGNPDRGDVIDLLARVTASSAPERAAWEAEARRLVQVYGEACAIAGGIGATGQASRAAAERFDRDRDALLRHLSLTPQVIPADAAVFVTLLDEAISSLGQQTSDVVVDDVVARMVAVEDVRDAFADLRRRLCDVAAAPSPAGLTVKPRCRCTHEQGDSRCEAHPTCAWCGEPTIARRESCAEHANEPRGTWRGDGEPSAAVAATFGPPTPRDPSPRLGGG